MKLITFINQAYVDIAHNLYIQLKNVNLHKNLTIHTVSKLAYDSVVSLKLDCEVKLYKPMLCKDLFNEDLNYDDGRRDVEFAIQQFLKYDCFYQEVLNHEFVCLLDADILVFEDFTNDIKILMNRTTKFESKSVSNFAFKYYLNVNIFCKDVESPKLYSWSGIHQIINSGFVVARQSDQTFNAMIDCYKHFVPHIGKSSCNTEEQILTSYFADNRYDICSIPDSIHMLNDSGCIYPPEEARRLHCKTFHPTFIWKKEKVDYIKKMKMWFI